MNRSYDLFPVNAQITFRNNLKKAFFKDNPFNKFKKISVERRGEIEKMATLCSLEFASFSIQERFYFILQDIKVDQGRGFKKKYDLLRGDEKHLFLLLAFDPTLVILRISLDSSDHEDYMNRVKEEFGFFPDQRVLTLEKFYNERFLIIENEFQQKL